MRCGRQGKVTTDVCIVVLIVVVSFLAAFGLFFLYPNPHRHPPDLYQKPQFNAMNAAVELSANEFDGYPPSDANDPTGRPYCGSMKLTEALMGQDLRGFHLRSAYRADGLDPNGLMPLYPPEPDAANLKVRKGPWRQSEAHRVRCARKTGGNAPSRRSETILLEHAGSQSLRKVRTVPV